jgi:hypothetical protein
MSVLKSLSIQISTLGEFWQEKYNSQIFRWNIILILLQLALLVFKFNDLPQQVPLYYSLPWGSQQLSHASNLFLLPTFSIIVGLINNLLATFFFHTALLFSRLLLITSLLFSLFSVITLLQIINLIS